MTSFRFEYYENVITKHHLAKVDWSQAAQWAFHNKLDSADVSIVSVRQLDADTVEIVKRKDQNLGMKYRYLGLDQQGLYERVTINRKDQSTAIDRMDGNWWVEQPFIGRRDLFYPEQRQGKAPMLAFVRHDFWMHKLHKACSQMQSHWSAWTFKRNFGKFSSQQ